MSDYMKNIPSIISQIGQRAEIIAATKTQSVQSINALKNYGIKIAGENRVQELVEKYDKISGLEWHFIGQLQTNKVKYIADKVVMIHSLDRPALADEIEKQCSKIGKKMSVLIELNLGEDTKGGTDLSGLNSLAEYAAKKEHLCLEGLMCMPAFDSGEEVYEKILGIFTKFKADFDGIKYLSCGTSHDYMRAIEYGSNMVRLGTALFGGR